MNEFSNPLDVRQVTNKLSSDGLKSTDVIPNILGEIQTYHTNSTFIDIGTLESLKKARIELKKLTS